MSKLVKLLIPILNIGITKNDLTKECGLIDVYTRNTNNTSDMDDHLYFLYDAENINEKSQDVFYKFLKSPVLYSFDNIKIKDHMYRLYTLSVFGKTALKLYRNAVPPISLEDQVRILKFWNLEDEEINKCVLGIDPYVDKDTKSVPEKDQVIKSPLNDW